MLLSVVAVRIRARRLAGSALKIGITALGGTRRGDLDGDLFSIVVWQQRKQPREA